MMEEPWRHSVEDTLSAFKTSAEAGLSSEEAHARFHSYGKNELPTEEKTPFWKLVANQFKDLMVLILLASAVISLILAFFEEGDRVTAFIEPLVIGLILLANAIIGVYQESNAEKAIDALKKLESRMATVLRDGMFCRMPSNELVPGDIVEIGVGDKIPADLRTISRKTPAFRVDQSMLTGESTNVTKTLAACPDAVATLDKKNMLFSGTVVTVGSALGVVVATGPRTAMGSIHRSFAEGEQATSPLQEKLDEFGAFLAKAILAICIVVWLINIGHFRAHGGWVRGAVYYFKIAVALAVAAIPEGLPAVVTTCLALGTKRMARKHAIVRNLPSVETLGCTTVICSDKTGTLTTNQMCVRYLLCADRLLGPSLSIAQYHVEGTSYEPMGRISALARSSSLEFSELSSPPVGHKQLADELENVVSIPANEACLADMGAIAALCNSARLEYDARGRVVLTGDGTEGSLLALAEKIGTPNAPPSQAPPSLYSDGFIRAVPYVPMQRSSTQSERPAHQPRGVLPSPSTHPLDACKRFWARQYEVQHTLCFTHERKRMSVFATEGHRATLLCKGAPESVLPQCTHLKLNSHEVAPMTDLMRQQLLQAIQAVQSRGLRCLAFATGAKDALPTLEDLSDPASYGSFETQLTFVGAAAMLDPPRIEVHDSISTCHQAGIRVIVVTGDNKDTAEAICKQIGLFPNVTDISSYSMTGHEFMALPPVEQQDALGRVCLLSRVEPSHKERLVEMLQESRERHVVAMTGDGVNDAPALNRAHIGIAMGSGTEVAKEASKMILANDNFATIVSAVEEGRAIYANTKQFIRYLISSNIGEVVSIFLTALLRMPEALSPVQLLWVNLATDGLPATALGFNKPDADIMQRPPRSPKEKIVDAWLFIRYMVIGCYVGFATAFGYIWWACFSSYGPQVSFYQLTHYTSCDSTWTVSCSVFSAATPCTISLTILVCIEMLNTLNSLSENQSLFVVTPFSNLWAVGAIILSLVFHAVLLYTPFLQRVFSVTPLKAGEWGIVFALSVPVLLIDEVLKWISRLREERQRRVGPPSSLLGGNGIV